MYLLWTVSLSAFLHIISLVHYRCGQDYSGLLTLFRPPPLSFCLWNVRPNWKQSYNLMMALSILPLWRPSALDLNFLLLSLFLPFPFPQLRSWFRLVELIFSLFLIVHLHLVLFYFPRILKEQKAGLFPALLRLDLFWFLSSFLFYCLQLSSVYPI